MTCAISPEMWYSLVRAKKEYKTCPHCCEEISVREMENDNDLLNRHYSGICAFPDWILTGEGE